MGLGRRATAATLAAVVTLGLAGCAAGEPADPEPSSPPPTSPAAPTSTPPAVERLTFGLWGPDAEVEVYQRSVDAFNDVSEDVEVQIVAYESASALAARVRAGEGPDVFLTTREDLGRLDAEQIQPVGDLLDERAVDFGDDYSRDALAAFSGDRELQCMPYGVFPRVVYVNTDLVDFAAMWEQGIDAPVDDEGVPAHDRWTFDQFALAAEFASSGRVKGLHVDPTLEGLAPFIYSGGGTVFDDEEAPTSLGFSSDETRDVLEQVLPLLRDPTRTLTEAERAEATPVQWFKRGRLGMLVGSRRLVPELREVEGLEFDVMPMPRVGGAATVGELTGVCVTPGESETVTAALDFLVDLTSAEQVIRMAVSGYLQPTNQDVSLSEAFLQPAREPAHAEVFLESVRALQQQPLIEDPVALDRAVAPALRDLLLQPVIDLEEVTTRIDEESAEVLSPSEETDGPDGTDEPSVSPSDSASPTG